LLLLACCAGRENWPKKERRDAIVWIAVARNGNESRGTSTGTTARIEIADFEGKELTRIFIADSIKKAEDAEDILREDGIDFAVALEAFVNSTSLFGGPRNGIAFYVVSGQAGYCRDLLASKGLAPGLVLEELP
jgi:hypothetical protein